MNILQTNHPQIRIYNPDLSIALLKMDEGQDYSLLIKDSQSIEEILGKEHKSTIRKQQLFAARYLLQELSKENIPLLISYSNYGKPYVKDSEWEISISHSKEYIALILCKARKVGIDIEVLDPRIFKIGKKFLRDDEKAFINPIHYLEQLYVIWSTKEVLFKIYEIGSLVFKDNLIVHPFEYKECGTIEAEIIKNDYQKTFTVHYQKHDELLMVYSMEH